MTPRSAVPARKKPATKATPAVALQQAVDRALEDLKAKDVRIIDVRGKTGVTDFMVIASGTSSRHVKSIADEVIKQAKEIGQPPLGVVGEGEAEGVLVDMGDIVVHVMLPRVREFYGLERLWSAGDVDSTGEAAEAADDLSA